MEKKAKPRITFYSDMNGPHEDQVRENARKTPEECWQSIFKNETQTSRMI